MKGGKVSGVKISSHLNFVKQNKSKSGKRFDKFSKKDEKLLYDKNGLIFQRNLIDEAFKLLRGNDFKIYLFIMRETFGYHHHKASLSLKYISDKTDIHESEVSKSISRLKKHSLPLISDHGSYGKDSNYYRVFSVNTGFEYDPLEQKIIPIEDDIAGNAENKSSNAAINDIKSTKCNNIASEFESIIPESIPKMTELISVDGLTTCENLKSSLEKNSSHIYIKKKEYLKKNNSSSKKQNCFSVLSPSFNSFSNSDLFFKGNQLFIPNQFLIQLRQEIPGVEKLSADKVQECFKGIDIWLDENEGPEILDEKFIIGWFKRNKSIQKSIKLILKPIRPRKSKTRIEPIADKIYESFQKIYSEYNNSFYGELFDESEHFKQRKACNTILDKMMDRFFDEGKKCNEENILFEFGEYLRACFRAGQQDESFEYYLKKLSPKFLISDEGQILREKLLNHIKENGEIYYDDSDRNVSLSVNTFSQAWGFN